MHVLHSTYFHIPRLVTYNCRIDIHFSRISGGGNCDSNNEQINWKTSYFTECEKFSIWKYLYNPLQLPVCYVISNIYIVMLYPILHMLFSKFSLYTWILFLHVNNCYPLMQECCKYQDQHVYGTWHFVTVVLEKHVLIYTIWIYYSMSTIIYWTAILWLTENRKNTLFPKNHFLLLHILRWQS